MTIALYAGSFDPLTNGHLDIVRATLAFADKLIVAIGKHPTKPGLFSYDKRKALIDAALQDACADALPRIEVIDFSGLLVEISRQHQASILVRGIRDCTDFDQEVQMAAMNQRLAPDLRTVFIPSHSDVRYISSTLVRQIASLGGDVSAFVPPVVAKALQEKVYS